MKKIKIAIFDADGTLFDSMPMYANIFSEILYRDYKISRKESKKYLISTAGLAIEKQIQHMLRKHRKKDASEQLKEEFYRIARKKKPTIFKDVIPTLKKLKHLKLFLSSGNSQELLNLRVRQFNLEKYFEEWLGFNGFKDKSEHLDHLIKKLKIKKEEFSKTSVYVADGSHDMAIARKYKITSFGRIGTLTKKELLDSGAVYTISDFTKLMQHIK